MTKIKPLDSIAKIFTGSDKYKQWMHQLNEQDGFVYGTDARCLIKADAGLFENKYPQHPKTANFKKLYENYTYSESPIRINISEVKLILLGIEKVYDTEACTECDGDGTVKCNYDHEHECPYCEGSGELEARFRDKVFPKEDHYIQVIDSFISPFYFDKMVKVADFMGAVSVSLVSYGTGAVHIFKVGESEILIMPVRKSNTEDWDEKTIHKLV